MKKSKLSTIILILVLIIGLSLLLYPTFSDYWNSLHQSRAIATYSEQVENLDAEKYDEILEEAIEYNESLLNRLNVYVLSEEQEAEYSELLDLTGTGIMGYIDIPSINCSLPIYHGTDEAVLQVAVGHMEWTSLPIGGESTHSALSGHRGLPSARLFTDLDQLREGDYFMFHVLNETLTYEVDQILIVEPNETEALLIEEGKDLCTLVTCTPYGVNSHRLLVRGHRVENVEDSAVVRVTADAVQVEPLLVAVIIAIPIVIILLSILISIDSKKNKKDKKNS